MSNSRPWWMKKSNVRIPDRTRRWAPKSSVSGNVNSVSRKHGSRARVLAHARIAARAFQLETSLARSVAFSAGTRNSLVVLPLALSVPGAIPVLPAVIVAQTLVELLAELAYVRIMPRLEAKRARAAAGPTD